jgi:hypothetical protein
MPGKNGSGPMGEGAMTGRRMGRCTNGGAGKQKSEDVQNVQSVENVKTPEKEATEVKKGRGLGLGKRGKGMGMGRRNRSGNGN